LGNLAEPPIDKFNDSPVNIPVLNEFFNVKNRDLINTEL